MKKAHFSVDAKKLGENYIKPKDAGSTKCSDAVEKELIIHKTRSEYHVRRARGSY